MVILLRNAMQIFIAAFATKKDSHLSRECPIVKMPKPNTTLFGLGKSEFSFLQMPEFDYKLE
jgi:hypothetical protein